MLRKIFAGLLIIAAAATAATGVSSVLVSDDGKSCPNAPIPAENASPRFADDCPDDC